MAADGHDVIVYCRNPGQRRTTYRGMRLVNLPAIRAKTLETISHTGVSTVHAAIRSRPAIVVMFNPANGPFVPLLRLAGIRTVVHFDGLDSKRAKWNWFGRTYYRFASRLSMRLADDVIADSRAIADHILQTYRRQATYIPYGAPIVSPATDRLTGLGLSSGEFHLVVSRFEPENNLDVIVDGYAQSRSPKPLIVVGAARYADGYQADVVRAASDSVRFVGSVWDQQLLDQLYGHCASYLHGHSVGGTNPSLLRAMGAGAPVIAYDVVFNRETAGSAARYFRDAADVASAIVADESDPSGAVLRTVEGRRRVAELYVWDDVARAYEALCRRALEGANG